MSGHVVFEPDQPIEHQMPIPGHPGWWVRATFAAPSGRDRHSDASWNRYRVKPPRRSHRATPSRHSSQQTRRHRSSKSSLRCSRSLGSRRCRSFTQPTRPGPAGYGDAFVRGPRPRGTSMPTASIHYDRTRFLPPVYPSVGKKRTHRSTSARRATRDLLLGATQGRAGGALSPRARTLLEGRDIDEVIRTAEGGKQ